MHNIKNIQCAGSVPNIFRQTCPKLLIKFCSTLPKSSKKENKLIICSEKRTFCSAFGSGSPWYRMPAPPPSFHASVRLSSECVRRGLLACLLLLAAREINSSHSHNITTRPFFYPLLICPSLRLVDLDPQPGSWLNKCISLICMIVAANGKKWMCY